jgi:uncharacterized protein (TIGR01777 family)
MSDLLWILISIQIAMGAFDTLYHHELTERLAWRPSQQHELWLHSIRNVLYAALFVTLGWFEPHGLWAIAVIVVLTIEVVITLMDFVEEDVSRKLPPSERINHTLLALNYGAILVLLVPQLLTWAGDRNGWTPAYYGLWSYLALASAIGVLIFGLRDWVASQRMSRLQPGAAGQLVADMPRMTVLVTGATGFLGRRLTQALAEAGHGVIALTRDPANATLLTPPYSLITSLEQIPGDTRIDAVVNLAGEPISDGLWTEAKRRRIVDSRVAMTRELVELMATLDEPPAVLINGSAIGWYGLQGDEALSEGASGESCFSRDVCEAWEGEALRAEALGVRVVCLRIGLVLGIEGGMLSRLLTPFEFGMGGPIGCGRQWMSWIERDDLVRLIAHAISTTALSGPLNATAPCPVRNDEFSQALGQALHRPALLRMPAMPLRVLGGDFARELLLGGQRVVPQKALASGFRFAHETLPDALRAILNGPDDNPAIADSQPLRPHATSARTAANRA